MCRDLGGAIYHNYVCWMHSQTSFFFLFSLNILNLSFSFVIGSLVRNKINLFVAYLEKKYRENNNLKSYKINPKPSNQWKVHRKMPHAQKIIIIVYETGENRSWKKKHWLILIENLHTNTVN